MSKNNLLPYIYYQKQRTKTERQRFRERERNCEFYWIIHNSKKTFHVLLTWLLGTYCFHCYLSLFEWMVTKEVFLLDLPQMLKSYFLRVPVLAQQKRIWLVSRRRQVPSLALLSRLWIWHCHELWHRSQRRLGPGVAGAVA